MIEAESANSALVRLVWEKRTIEFRIDVSQEL
jgi:hypothetical protein